VKGGEGGGRGGWSGLLAFSVGGARRRSVRPAPVLNFRHVLAVFVNISAMFNKLVAQMLRHVCGFGSETRHPFNHVHCQMEAIERVEHRHVARRGPRASSSIPSTLRLN